MNRDQKAAVIDKIAADIEASTAVFAVDYRGITVAQVAELRDRLREADASFTVVKNSLTERAADRVGAEDLKALLSGPTALTFVRGDAAAAAKAVADQARATQLLPFKGGVMDGAPLSAVEVGAIARLPSREVLYGQLVGLVAAPISGVVRTLNALISGVAIQLGGVLEKKQSGEIPAGADPERATPAAEAEAPAAEAEAETPAAEAPVADAPAETAQAPAAEAPAEAETPAAEAETEAPAAEAPPETPAAEAETPAPDAPAAQADPEPEAPAENDDNPADASADTAAAKENK